MSDDNEARLVAAEAKWRSSFRRRTAVMKLAMGDSQDDSAPTPWTEEASGLAVAAGASAATEAWNTCPTCKQLVDADEVFDGTEVHCWGCDKRFACASYPDGSWELIPCDFGEEEDDE